MSFLNAYLLKQLVNLYIFIYSFYCYCIIEINMDKKSTVNITSKSLIDSVVHGKIKALKVLLDGGADPNTTVFDNIPILSIAIISVFDGKGAEENILKLLIERNADINKGDTNFRTPLMFSCMYPHCSETIVDFLLMHGADVSLKDRFGNTALDYAIKFKQLKTAKKVVIACRKLEISSIMISTITVESLLDARLQDRDTKRTEGRRRRRPCKAEINGNMIQRQEYKDGQRFESVNISAITAEFEDEVKSLDTKCLSSECKCKQHKNDIQLLPNVVERDESIRPRQLSINRNRGRCILSSESSFECTRERNAKRNYQSAVHTRNASSANGKDGLNYSSSYPSLSEHFERNLNVRRNWCRRLSDDISRSRRTSCQKTSDTTTCIRHQ